jgi:hypothetical protein
MAEFLESDPFGYVIWIGIIALSPQLAEINRLNWNSGLFSSVIVNSLPSNGIFVIQFLIFLRSMSGSNSLSNEVETICLR